MNTKIEYMYRDADNYKKWHEEVLKEEVSQQQKEAITSCLNDGEYFIPHQVGLPEIRFEQVTESDHSWFELCPDTGLTCTNSEPTVGMTVDELVSRFQEAKDRWDDRTFAEFASTVLGAPGPNCRCV